MGTSWVLPLRGIETDKSIPAFKKKNAHICNSRNSGGVIPEDWSGRQDVLPAEVH